MKINWKVRIKNPVFWWQVFLALILPIITYFGLTVEDLTSWKILGEVFLQAISNPYVLAMAAISVWNAVLDPTTKGISDSTRAMSYETPGKPKEGGGENGT